jgi:hypothetical protein
MLLKRSSVLILLGHVLMAYGSRVIKFVLCYLKAYDYDSLEMAAGAGTVKEDRGNLMCNAV